jgi:6-phosphogluconolactonase
MAGVYVQTNEANGNRLLAFGRRDDGTLDPWGAVETGGRGDGVPHLTSQGSVVLAGGGRHLLVTNSGSGDVSLFALGDGPPRLLGTFASGPAPKSVAAHGDLVYVLNSGDASLAGFRLGDRRLDSLSGSRRELGAGADPAQVGFSPDGSKLVVTQRGTDELAIFAVGPDGLLGGRHVVASSGPTPYGFAFAPDGTLVVTEAFGAQRGKAAASSYAPGNGSLAPVSRSVGNGRSEICWAVVTNDGRYAFTTNFADGAVSRYALGADASLTLENAAAGTAREGATGLRDEDVSGDGRFLYAIDADSRHIFGWAIGAEGSLTPVGDWEGVPATVAGLAAS